MMCTASPNEACTLYFACNDALVLCCLAPIEVLAFVRNPTFFFIAEI